MKKPFITTISIASYLVLLIACIVFFLQTQDVIQSVLHHKKFEKGIFIVKEQAEKIKRKGKEIELKGLLNDSVEAKLSLGYVNDIVINENNESNDTKYDTIKIWYLPHKNAGIAPRLDSEASFPVMKNLFPQYRLFFLSSLVFFIIVQIVNRKSKRNPMP